MPIMIIGILIWLFWPRKRRRRSCVVVSYDPVKLARERDRQRKEADRIADRQRRIELQETKERERQQKQLAAAKANQEKARNNQFMIEQLNTYLQELKAEIKDDRLSSEQYFKIYKEILRVIWYLLLGLLTKSRI